MCLVIINIYIMFHRIMASVNMMYNGGRLSAHIDMDGGTGDTLY